MALKVNADAQLIFFDKVFGLGHPTTAKVQGLISLGVKFEVGLFNLTAKMAGQSYQMNLTKGSTAFMKGSVDGFALTQNQKLVTDWVNGLIEAATKAKLTPTSAPTMKLKPESPVQPVQSSAADSFSVVLTGAKPEMNLIIAIKAARKLLGVGLKPAKDMIEAVQAGKVVVFSAGSTQSVAEEFVNVLAEADVIALAMPDTAVGAFLAGKPLMEQAAAWVPPVGKPKPTSGVIHLRDAKAVGQKVHGTSHGSVYHCIALNERIRVAARVFSGGQISVRAEWDNATPSELERLKEAGFSMKGAYASIHLNSENVPHARVIGSFIIGLGIEWQDALFNASSIVVEGK